jgi:hypothetical protein
MKLYEIEGKLRLVVRDPSTGKSGEIPYRKILTKEQADVMETDPDMILQFCHYLSDLRKEGGLPPFAIRADLTVSVNGSPPRRVIDPGVDLTSERRTLWPYAWIYPLH